MVCGMLKGQKSQKNDRNHIGNRKNEIGHNITNRCEGNGLEIIGKCIHMFSGDPKDSCAKTWHYNFDQ